MVRQVLRQFGISRVDGVLLRLVGAYQADDGSGVDQVEIVMRGRHEELDMGNAKAGEGPSHKQKFQHATYKMSIKGRVEMEHANTNAVFSSDGVERNEDIPNVPG